MSNVKISEKAFCKLYLALVENMDIDLTDVKLELTEKFIALKKRELYSTWHNVELSEQERQKAKEEYLRLKEQ